LYNTLNSDCGGGGGGDDNDDYNIKFHFIVAKQFYRETD
jgi:hypothetical protein